MTHLDWRAFVALLEQEGELVRVKREVDPRFEVAAVVAALGRAANQALLFERVRGSRVPLLSNAFGSFRRLGLLLGVGEREVVRTWAACEAQLPAAAQSWVADVTARYEPLDVLGLPLLTHSEKDGGPYITAGVVIARDPATGAHNLSYHRIQARSPERMGFRITPGNHLGVLFDAAEAEGRNLPVTVLIGAPPLVMMAAAARLPLYTDEFRLASALGGGPLAVQGGRTNDLIIPQGTEIVLEGELLAGLREPEGPFGDFMDAYIPVGLQHVLKINAAYARPDALYYGLSAGSSEQLLMMGVPTAAAILQAVRRVVPSARDAAIWPITYNCVIQMEEEFDGQAKQALLAAFGAEPSYVKICTVVDCDVDVYDPADVTWAMASRMRPDRDVLVIPNVPSFRRDPDAIHWGRLGIDATRPFGAAEAFERRRIPGQDSIKLADYLG